VKCVQYMQIAAARTMSLTELTDERAEGDSF
jgi:hypothetical protein